MDAKDQGLGDACLSTAEVWNSKRTTMNSDQSQSLVETTLDNQYQIIKFIDLFCGIGGFHQAFKLLPIASQCVFACDIDKECRVTYKNNYGIEPDKDITKIDIPKIPKFDVLCGGFPCQPFSKAGHQKGFNDKDRGNLFFNICEIIKYHLPSYIILENVKNSDITPMKIHYPLILYYLVSLRIERESSFYAR